MLKSFVYLLGLYYFRYIPINIFWGLYSPTLAKSNFKNTFLGKLSGIILIFISYAAGLFMLVSLFTLILNIIIAKNWQNIFLPLIFAKDDNLTFGQTKSRGFQFSFLLSRLFWSKRITLPFKFFLRLMEFLALVSVGIGIVELSNDFSSHLNPDFLDILFPQSGAFLFYGGITLFSLSSFFLYFALPQDNIQKWKARIQESQPKPKFIKKLIISQALLHPYFFLSPHGRHSASQNQENQKRLSLLLEKALLENKDRIPEEWLEKQN